MNFSEFQQKVRHILAVDLPSGKTVVEQARSMATDIKIGRTAFLDKMGVSSELEYKKQCLKDNRPHAGNSPAVESGRQCGSHPTPHGRFHDRFSRFNRQHHKCPPGRG